MSFGRIILFLLTAAVMLGASFQSAGPAASAEPTTLTDFATGDEEGEALFVNLGGGADLENNIHLPVDVTVSEAHVSLRGADDGNDNYPTAVSLDVYTKDSSSIYQYSGVGYGSWGRQNTFMDNTEQMKLEFRKARTDASTHVLLPKGADVSSASMRLSAQEWDSLLGISEITPVNDSHYEHDLAMTTTNGKVYVAYKTFNPYMVENWRDPGIVIHGSSDGRTWNPPLSKGVQITSVDDYRNGVGAWDWQPDLFADSSGRLYCVWESNNTWDGTGEDYDILISWSDTPLVEGSWSDPVDISSPLEGSYSSHSALRKYRSDTGAQYFDLPREGKPQDWWAKGIEYDGELYVVWTTNDTTSAQCDFQGGEGVGSDIVLAKSSNGMSWTLVGELTEESGTYDDSKAGDHDPRLAIHDNKLWVFWYSNGSTFATDKDYDILARYYDANTGSFSDIWEVNDYGGPLGIGWDKSPYPFVFDDELYCTWYSHDQEYTTGPDADIVVKKWDGDDWHVSVSDSDYDEYREYEITPPGDTETSEGIWDKWPAATVYNNRIYITWSSNDAHHTSGTDSDIVFSSSADGKTWTPVDVQNGEGTEICERGLPGEDGPDYEPMLTTLGNSLLFVWKTGASPTSAHNHPDYPTETDVVSRLYSDSTLPIDVKIDVGNDGSYEFTGSVSDAVEEFDIKSAVQSAVDSMAANFTDAYGNELVNISVAVEAGGVGKIILESVDIVYDYEVTTEDFSKDLNKYIDANAEGDEIDIPLKIISSSPGVVELFDLEVTYSHKPHITITFPDVNGAVAYNDIDIYWEDEDIDDDATITLYYNVVPEVSGSMVEIVTSEPIKEDPDGMEGDMYNWDMSALDDNNGTGKDYWVIARIDDGTTTDFHVSEGPVHLILRDEPPTMGFIDPALPDEAGPVDYLIKWWDEDDDSNANITLYYSTKNKPNAEKTLIDGAKNLPEDPDGEVPDENGHSDTFLWDTSRVPAGLYYIHGIIEDDEGSTMHAISVGRVNTTRTSIADVSNFRPARTHDETPTITWDGPNNPAREEEKYFIRVQESGSTEFIVDDVTGSEAYTIPSGTPLRYNTLYYVSIKAQLGLSAVSNFTSFEMEVYNTRPPTPQVTWDLQRPKTDDTLKVTIQDLNTTFDVDGDPVTYRYEWYKGTNLISNLTSDQVASTLTSKDDKWEVRIIPNDGIEDGVPANLSAYIENTAPEATLDRPVSGDTFGEGEDIEFLGSGWDADDDDLTFIWKSEQVGQLIDQELPLEENGQTQQFSRTLPPGEHTIILVILDGDGSTEVNVTISVKASGGDSGSDSSGQVDTLTIAVIAIAIIGVVMVLVVMIVLKKRREAEMDLDDLMDDPNAPKSESSALYGSDFSEESLDRKLEGGGGPPDALPPAGGPPQGPPPGA